MGMTFPVDYCPATTRQLFNFIDFDNTKDWSGVNSVMSDSAWQCIQPRQELPFHRKASSKRNQPVAGLRPESRLYGGGTLPPGFEHLESLRRSKDFLKIKIPQTSYNFSILVSI
jgi:hypothetical protein